MGFDATFLKLRYPRFHQADFFLASRCFPDRLSAAGALIQLLLKLMRCCPSEGTRLSETGEAASHPSALFCPSLSPALKAWLLLQDPVTNLQVCMHLAVCCLCRSREKCFTGICINVRGYFKTACANLTSLQLARFIQRRAALMEKVLLSVRGCCEPHSSQILANQQFVPQTLCPFLCIQAAGSERQAV